MGSSGKTELNEEITNKETHKISPAKNSPALQ